MNVIQEIQMHISTVFSHIGILCTQLRHPTNAPHSHMDEMALTSYLAACYAASQHLYKAYSIIPIEVIIDFLF